MAVTPTGDEWEDDAVVIETSTLDTVPAVVVGDAPALPEEASEPPTETGVVDGGVEGLSNAAEEAAPTQETTNEERASSPPMANSDDQGATITDTAPVTPAEEGETEHQGDTSSLVSDSGLDPDSVLARSIQNTLKVMHPKDEEIGTEEAAPTNPGMWKATGRHIKQYKAGKAILNGIRDGMAGAEAAIQKTCATTETKNESHPANKQEATADPGLWKLTGRKIKQFKAGRVVLGGIRDGARATSTAVHKGIEGTKKTLGIGSGTLRIHVPQEVFAPETSVRGRIALELTEPIQADSLTIRLLGVHEGSILEDRKKIYDTEYPVSGKQVYPCKGSYPFEILIPRTSRKMSEETRTTTVGSVIASVQAVSDSVTPPTEWYLRAALAIPGRLNMTQELRIPVASEEY